MSEPLSKFGVTGVTVSVEIADVSYGAGQKRFCSVSSRLPDGVEGLPMTSSEVIDDGIKKYFAAWQTLLQAALATNQIESSEFKAQPRSALRRIKKVRAIFKRIVAEEVD